MKEHTFQVTLDDVKQMFGQTCLNKTMQTLKGNTEITLKEAVTQDAEFFCEIGGLPKEIVPELVSFYLQ